MEDDYVEREPRIRIDDFRTEKDEREQHEGYNEKTKDMYNAMLSLILDHKKELQKIPAASSLESATQWAKKRGLRAGTEDFNHDGIKEVVVYNKAGRPFIINGYKLKSSDYGIRNKFYTQFPRTEDRLGENMRRWTQEQAYKIEENPEKPWRYNITKTDFGRELEDTGYKLPSKPKKKLSVFNIFCKLIAPKVKEYYESEEGYPQNLLGPKAKVINVKILKKIVSPISMYRMLFSKMIERSYFYFFREQKRFGKLNYKQFKEFIKKNDNRFYQWFLTNYIDVTTKDFKPSRITPLVIQGQIARDEVNWDGSDPEDAIVFLIGVDNWNDTVCNAILTDPEEAQRFLNSLEDKSDKEHKTVLKLLDGFKRTANESQKMFFKEVIRYVFENDEAEERHRQAKEAGINELAMTTQRAVDESAENPPSPMKDAPQVEQQQEQPPQ